MSKTFTPFPMIVVLLSGVTAILLALTFRAEAQRDGSAVKIGVIGTPEEPRFSEIVGGGFRVGLASLAMISRSYESLSKGISGGAHCLHHSRRPGFSADRVI